MTATSGREAPGAPSGGHGGISLTNLTTASRIKTPPTPAQQNRERSDSIYVLTDDPLENLEHM